MIRKIDHIGIACRNMEVCAPRLPRLRWAFPSSRSRRSPRRRSSPITCGSARAGSSSWCRAIPTPSIARFIEKRGRGDPPHRLCGRRLRRLSASRLVAGRIRADRRAVDGREREADPVLSSRGRPGVSSSRSARMEPSPLAEAR